MKKSLAIFIILIIAIILIISFIYKSDIDVSVNGDMGNMKIKSIFANNERIPIKYTCDGDDINPPLEIFDIPENAKSLVLIVDDPDAPVGTWDHWVLFNIDTAIAKIDEDSIPRGAIQGKNSWERNDYGGPCPPSGTHRYFFKLYALNTILDLNKNAEKVDVERAMRQHIIGKTELIGLYSRE